MSESISFFTQGRPIPQGSKRIGAHGQMYDQAGDRLTDWRQAIGWDARIKLGAKRLEIFDEGPIEIYATFYFLRPKKHQKMPEPPAHHLVKPDLDKLLRAVLDALTGVVYRDDSQVAHIFADKKWIDDPKGEGVEVVVHNGVI